MCKCSWTKSNQGRVNLNLMRRVKLSVFLWCWCGVKVDNFAVVDKRDPKNLNKIVLKFVKFCSLVITDGWKDITNSK